ncbi:hypothetical protein [Nocardia ninae]|uniref:hypothetical protein n=1 Tax=Nocardia ninae TaxID=356145 RepID=UPI0011BF7ABC|nr:hypothetical protein [Nocardia ninae]
MRAEVSAAEKAGTELKLTLDLDGASYDRLRTEFLEMTTEAQRSSGLSRAAVAKRCAGKPGRQTVYNYAGNPTYTSFPKPALLQKYLESCELPPEQIEFAVARCAEIRRRFPEAGKAGLRGTEESPRPQADGVHSPGRYVSGSGPVAGQRETVLPNTVNAGPGTPLSAQPGGWSEWWRGLTQRFSPRRTFSPADVYGSVGTRFITPLPATQYEPHAYEPWQPRDPAVRAVGAESATQGHRWWVGSVLRDSGVRVSPGRMALRFVREELADPRSLENLTAASLIRKAYGAAGITLRTRAGEQAEAGVHVPFENAEPGDILILADGRECLYAGNGLALLFASSVGGSYGWLIPRDQVRTTRRITWESVLLADRPAQSPPTPTVFDAVPPSSTDIPPGPRDGAPAQQVTMPSRPADSSTERVISEYEAVMGAVTERVEAAARAAEPGPAALRAIDRLVFPYAGSQAWLVREAFKAIDLPLPPDIRFELPVMAVAVRHVDLRPGDIVFTESGVLGIYGGRGELVYLGPAGTKATSVLQPALYVAAWRVTAVPARTGYGLVSSVAVVDHDGTGRLARIYRAGERRSGRHRRVPETAEVVAMVIEVVERAKQRGVAVPLSGRELFTAAKIRGGVEFTSVTTAWDPVREPVYPRDARLRNIQAVSPADSATAAELMMARLATAAAGRWSARNRPGVA